MSNFEVLVVNTPVRDEVYIEGWFNSNLVVEVYFEKDEPKMIFFNSEKENSISYEEMLFLLQRVNERLLNSFGYEAKHSISRREVANL